MSAGRESCLFEINDITSVSKTREKMKNILRRPVAADAATVGNLKRTNVYISCASRTQIPYATVEAYYIAAT